MPPLADVLVPQSLVNWLGGLGTVAIIAFATWLLMIHRSMITVRANVDKHTDDISALKSAHEKHADIDTRMATVEEQTKTIFRTLEKMDNKLDRLIERR